MIPTLLFSPGYSEVFDGIRPMPVEVAVPLEQDKNVIIYDPLTSRCFEVNSKQRTKEKVAGTEKNFCLLLADWIRRTQAKDKGDVVLFIKHTKRQFTIPLLLNDAPAYVLFGLSTLGDHFTSISRLNDAIGVFTETEYAALIKSSARRNDQFTTLVEQRGYITAKIMEVYWTTCSWFGTYVLRNAPQDEAPLERNSIT